MRLRWLSIALMLLTAPAWAGGPTEVRINEAPRVRSRAFEFTTGDTDDSKAIPNVCAEWDVSFYAGTGGVASIYASRDGATKDALKVTLSTTSSDALTFATQYPFVIIDAVTAPSGGTTATVYLYCRLERSAGLQPNSAVDTDGDGLKDYALVADYNGNDVLEIADIQAAHDALRISTRDPGGLSATATGFSRSSGSFDSDRLADGMQVWVGGFGHLHAQGALAAKERENCLADSSVVDYDCFERPSGSWITDGWAVGMVVYSRGFRQTRNNWSPVGSTAAPRLAVVTGVSALELEVSERLWADAAQPERWVLSPGNNGYYTITAHTATTITTSPAPPKTETGNGEEKIQATNPITLELVSGTFLPPSTAPAGNDLGLLELESFTTLVGQGVNATILQGNQGIVDRAPISTMREQNFSYTRDVEIAHLQVRGGWGDDDGTEDVLSTSTAGIKVTGAMNVAIHDVQVQETGHACIYQNNIWGSQTYDVVLTKCGNWNGAASITLTGKTGSPVAGEKFTNGSNHAIYISDGGIGQKAYFRDARSVATGTWTGQVSAATLTASTTVTFSTQPAIYWFAVTADGASGWTADVSLSDFDVSNAATTLINTRENALGDRIYGLSIRNGVARDSQSLCLSPRGTIAQVVEDLKCYRTAGLQFYSSHSDYGQEGEVKGFRGSGIHLIDNTVDASAPLLLAAYHTDVVIDDLTIRGSTGSRSCLDVYRPQRGTKLTNVLMEDCGARSLAFQGTMDDAQSQTDETLVFDGLTIRRGDRVDPFASGSRWQGIVFLNAVAGVDISNFRIEGSTGDGIEFSAASRNMTFRGGFIEAVEPGFQGKGDETWANQLPTAGMGYRWVLTTNASGASDCTFGSGTGTFYNACYYNPVTAAWTDFAPGNNECINLGSVAHTDFKVSDLELRNCLADYAIDGTGDVDGAVFSNIRVLSLGFDDGASGGPAADGLGGLRLPSGSSDVLAQGITCTGTSGDCVTSLDANPWAPFHFLSDLYDAGAPSGTCVTGSVYRRSDGGTDTTFYACENGAWSAL